MNKFFLLISFIIFSVILVYYIDNIGTINSSFITDYTHVVAFIVEFVVIWTLGYFSRKKKKVIIYKDES